MDILFAACILLVTLGVLFVAIVIHEPPRSQGLEFEAKTFNQTAGRVTSEVVDRYDMDSDPVSWEVATAIGLARKDICGRGVYSRGPTDWHNLFMAK